MASSITLTSSKHNSRYFKLECTQESNGSAENSSTITWKLSAVGDDTWYSTGPTKVVINGTTVYSKDRVSWDYGKFPVAQGSTSGTITVPHNADGTKKIAVKFSTAIYTSTVSEYSDTWTLDSIPRYGTCKQSYDDATETTIKMGWSSDSTVDYIWYSKDNGSNWTGVNVTDGESGTYTISGLAANTTYKVKTRIRRKDSQLTTDSAALSVTTYDYPHCTNSPNFVLGDELTLSFYNPLGRSFVFYIIGNGTQIDVEYKCSGTTYRGVNSTTTSVPYLYATIPNAKSGKYKVKVVYGSSTKTRDSGNTYTIKESACYPTFSKFTYADTNPQVTAITGSDQILVKKLSSVTVSIAAADKMVAKNSAAPDYYIAQLDTKTQDADYNTANVSIPLGVINSAGKKRLSVRAYDSRTLSTLAHKDVTVYDYEEPTINASVKRLNNFEAQTTLKISGTYSRLTIGGTDKNTLRSIKYRWRETGGAWSDTVALAATVTIANATKCNFACQDIVRTFDNTKSFEIEVLVLDAFSQSTKPLNVDVGQAILFVSSNKKTCYMNGTEMVSADNVRQMKYYNQLAEGTDLNKVVEIGTYRSIQASHTTTMKNVPAAFDGGFTLYVTNWTATPTNTAHRRQEVIYGRMTYVRRTLDGGATWTDWNTLALLEDIFPVGSVVCRSTNTNPSATYGGAWELIDKGFKSLYVTNDKGFTAAANVVNGGTHYSVGDHTIRIRQKITVNAAMSDTGMTLGAFDWSVFGLSNMPMGINDGVAYSDGANGGISWSVAYTGGVTQTDVFDTTSIASGGSFHIDFTFTVVPSLMLDDYCDKFYWKRTS